MRLARRTLLAAAPLALTGCHHDLSPQDVNITGLVPDLDFTMTEAQTGAVVTAASFAGHVTMLYFGYTNCPDVCPTTLYNADRIFQAMGPKAADFRILFVTVDPDRDTLPVLTQYTGLFGKQVLGLRGTPDQLFTLARRYRVVFSVTKSPVYSVTHSSAIYVFDGQGKAHFIIAGLDTNEPDIKGIAADLDYVEQTYT